MNREEFMLWLYLRAIDYCKEKAMVTCQQCGNTEEDGVEVCEVCRLCDDCHDHAIVVRPKDAETLRIREESQR